MHDVVCSNSRLQLNAAGASGLKAIGMRRGEASISTNGMTFEISLGALRADRYQRIIVRAEFDPGLTHDPLPVHIAVEGRRSNGKLLSASSEPLLLHLRDSSATNWNDLDTETCLEAAKAVRDFVQREDANFN